MARPAFPFRIVALLLLCSIFAGVASAFRPFDNPFAGRYEGDILTNFGMHGNLSLYVLDDGTVNLSRNIPEVAE